MVKRRWTRGRVIGTGAMAAAGVVSLLIVLIALGILVLPKASPSPLTVESVHWSIDQGVTSQGIGWFGPSQFNYTSLNGYPYQVAPGKSLVITWQFSNFDTLNHTIVNVSTTNGFSVKATTPTLPLAVAASQDDAYLMVTVTVPNSPGADLVLDLTILAS